MNPSQGNIISKIIKRNKITRRIFVFILIMSFLVSGEVMWNLRSMVLTLANETVCGKEEHIHSEECFDNDGNLICSLEEHIHTPECYSDEYRSQDNDTKIVELDSVTVNDGNNQSVNIETGLADDQSGYIEGELADDQFGYIEAEPSEAEQYYIEGVGEIQPRADYSQANTFYVDQLNGRTPSVTSTSSSNRYSILKGDSFKLIIYDSSNSSSYFYDPDNSGTIKIENSQSTLDGRRIVIAAITAIGAGNVTIAFSSMRFYINIIDRIPDTLYLINNNTETVISSNSSSNRNKYLPGDEFSLCIYHKFPNPDPGYGEPFFYDTVNPNGSNTDTVITVKNGGYYSGQLRKVIATVKVNKAGEADVSFKTLKFWISSESYESGKIFVIDPHGNESSIENSSENPYIMCRNETLSLCYYEIKHNGAYDMDWFYCISDSGSDASVILNYNNSDDYITDTVRKVTAKFTALKQGSCTVVYKNIYFYIDVRQNYSKKNIIYVNTTLGEREKDKVHEYISDVGGDTSEHDGKYYYNTEKRAYIMYPGECVELSIYLDSAYTNYYFFEDTSGCLSPDKKSNNWDEDSRSRKSSAKYTAVKPGSCVIKVQTSPDNILSFYVFVRDRGSDNKCDHADIEVSDGGCYEIVKTVVYADGTSVTTRTNYDSYIIAVNSCELSGSDNQNIMNFISSDYELKGNPGESQYELTSKYRCMNRPEKKYNPGLVYHAKFNVKMLLKPTTVTVIKKVNDEVTDINITDVKDDTGNSDLTLPNVEFVLQTQNKVDALNKCPDHSGLDFNVAAALNDVINVSPVTAEIKAQKILTGESLTDKQFSFSLIDNEGKTVNTAYNDSNGNIRFEHYFLTPGTYDFKMKENVPVPSGHYQYDTDTRNIQVLVSEQTVNGQKQLAANVIYNSNMTFKNTVLLSTDLKVIKSWSDGNEIHSGDSIFFVIYRRKNNDNEEIISIGGISKFELSSSSGWNKTFSGLPVQDGETRYTYRIEEDYVQGYVSDYEPGTIDPQNISETTSVRIVNSLKKPTSISIRKKWTDSSGVTLAGNPPVESVTAVVKREYKKIKIPVLIELYSSVYPQKLIRQFKEYAYTESDFSFNIYNDMSKVSVSSVTIINDGKTRSGNYSNNVINVRNIEYGDIVRVYCDRQYNQASDPDIFYIRQSFTGSREGWTGRGALLGDAYSTFYTSAGSGGSQSLKIYNRTAQWKGASLDVKSQLAAGKKYSISAYVLWNNTFTDSGGAAKSLESHTTELILTLEYNSASDSNLHYTSVCSIKNAQVNTWTLLENPEFQVPGDAVNPYLVVETTESSDQGCSDLYIDEVTVASEGTIVSVNSSGKVYIGNASDYQYTKVNEIIPEAVRQSAENWTLDTADIWKEAELSASNNWTATLTSAELSEKEDRIYRYYTYEKNKVSGYEKIDPADRISSNTVWDPLIIENRQVQYELPATGGTGTVKYYIAGLAFMFLPLIYIFYCSVIVRRRKYQKKTK